MISPSSRGTVTVVIPSYNKYAFLPETLLSVRNQTYPRFECIIVDDHSDDGSYGIAAEFSSNDERFRLVRSPTARSGPSVCRNIGIESSVGEYIIFLDADDLIADDCLAQRVSVLRNNPNLDLAVFPIQNFRKFVGDEDFIWSSKKSNALKRFLSFDIPWPVMAPIWTRRFISDDVRFPEALRQFEDVVFHAEALLSQNPTYEIQSGIRPDAFYRIAEERMLDSHVDRLEKVINASHESIIRLELLTRTQGHLRKALRGIYWCAMRELDAAKEHAQISDAEYAALYRRLNGMVKSTSIYSRTSRQIWRTYHSVVNKVGRVKGMGYVSREALLKVP